MKIGWNLLKPINEQKRGLQWELIKIWNVMCHLQLRDNYQDSVMADLQNYEMLFC